MSTHEDLERLKTLLAASSLGEGVVQQLSARTSQNDVASALSRIETSRKLTSRIAAPRTTLLLQNLKTVVMLTALSGAILCVGSFWGSAGIFTALALALSINGIACAFGDRIALRFMRAHPISEIEEPVLYSIVRELSETAQQPMPRLYLSETPQPNAFAVGRSPRSAAICCTRGLLQILNQRELRAVVSHELSHIYSRDTLVSSTAAAITAIITSLAGLPLLRIGHSSDDEGPGFLGTLLMLLLGPLATLVLQTFVSRRREFRADALAITLTNDPLALASALRKIQAGVQALPLPADPGLLAISHLLIAHPFTAGGLASLFATHPPTNERIARLEDVVSRKPTKTDH